MLKGKYVGAAFLLALGIGGATAEVPLAPYPADYFKRVNSSADVRFLLDAPAGKGGFITIHNGHLITPDGRRFRCWGVDETGFALNAELLPSHTDADIYAATLPRLGINCARLHFLDRTNVRRRREGDARTSYKIPITASPAGLIDGSRDDTKVFSPEQFDKLDYLVAALKRNGVYVDLNLNVGRTYKKNDGVPDYNKIGVGKGIAYFSPELIARQKEYARALLTHYNPYTKTKYSDEPAVAIVEITNENSLLEDWMRNWLRGAQNPEVQAGFDITPYYRQELIDLYQKWLLAHRKPEQIARLRTLAGVGPNQPVPILKRGEFAAAPKERFYTEMDFLTATEMAFNEQMVHLLRDDLHVKSVIIGTSDHIFQMAGQPLQRVQQHFGILDGHVYWQHPAIYGKRGTPMVNDPLHSMAVKLARFAMVGKPFVNTESNEPFPNDYEAEMIPILASYAALQDWDGIFLYDFEPKVSGAPHDYISEQMDISSDPVKMAQLPVGALIFERGDVKAARQTIERTYSKDQVAEAARMPISEWPYWTPGFPLSIPLKHGSRVKCLDCAPTAKITDTVDNPIISDTGELTWRVQKDSRGENQNGIVTIDSDRTNGLIGFINANPTVKVTHLSADIKNDFAALTLSSLDNEPISNSNLMLLTATSRVENTGSVWNERHSMLKVWGTAPTVIEPITGWIQLKGLAGAVAVTATALDGAANPIKEIPARYLETSWEFPVGDPVTTSYIIRVVR